MGVPARATARIGTPSYGEASPNRVQFKMGQPAQLRVVTGQQVGCTSVFTIPSLGVERALPRNGAATVAIPTDRPGKVRFTCGMGMYSGTVEVVP